MLESPDVDRDVDVDVDAAAKKKATLVGLAGLVWAYIPVVLIARGSFGYVFEGQALRNWSTIFVSLTLQAIPFLVLGTVISAAISALVPASWIANAVPRRTVSTAASDFLQAGGFLVAGAGLVAAMQTLVPPSVFDHSSTRR